MDEQPEERDGEAAFETRAVLRPGRGRGWRFIVAAPAIGLLGIALVGLLGHRSGTLTAGQPADRSPALASAPIPRSSDSAPRYPTEVLGLTVRNLGDVQLAGLDRNQVVAVAGWYVTLAITRCPPLAATFAQPSAGVEPGFDPFAYCERSGVLYATPPDPPGTPGAINHPAGVGPESVDASVVRGVVLPGALQLVNAAPTPVVVLGRFVETSSACMLVGACPSELVVDYLGWPPASGRAAAAGG